MNWTSRGFSQQTCSSREKANRWRGPRSGTRVTYLHERSASRAHGAEGGPDAHRRRTRCPRAQITYDYLDLRTGEEVRGVIKPATREAFAAFLDTIGLPCLQIRGPRRDGITSPGLVSRRLPAMFWMPAVQSSTSSTSSSIRSTRVSFGVYPAVKCYVAGGASSPSSVTPGGSQALASRCVSPAST